MVRQFVILFKKAALKWSDDNAMRLAASLAYYTAFSLSPLLLAAIGIAGLIFGYDAASGQIYQQLKGALGHSVANAIQELVEAASKPVQGVTGTLIASGVVLFGASGVFGELKDSLNIIWKLQPKEGSGIWMWIRGRFLSIGMVLGICFLLLVSLVVNTGLGAAAEYGTALAPSFPLLMQAAGIIISFGFVTVLFAMLFKYLPDTGIAWRDVWLGSVVTAFLFTLGKSGLELYIAKAAPASAYGAAGALALVLVWVYYSAQIFLMGAEFTAVYAEERGSKSASAVPPPLPPPLP